MTRQTFAAPNQFSKRYLAPGRASLWLFFVCFLLIHPSLLSFWDPQFWHLILLSHHLVQIYINWNQVSVVLNQRFSFWPGHPRLKFVTHGIYFFMPHHINSNFASANGYIIKLDILPFFIFVHPLPIPLRVWHYPTQPNWFVFIIMCIKQHKITNR